MLLGTVSRRFLGTLSSRCESAVGRHLARSSLFAGSTTAAALNEISKVRTMKMGPMAITKRSFFRESCHKCQKASQRYVLFGSLVTQRLETGGMHRVSRQEKKKDVCLIDKINIEIHKAVRENEQQRKCQ